MKALVKIMPKKGVLDPQGKAIEKSKKTHEQQREIYGKAMEHLWQRSGKLMEKQ